MKKILIIILALPLTFIFSQDKVWEYGMGVNIGTRGYGISGNLVRYLNQKISIGASLSIVDVVAQDEIRGMDYYGRQLVFNDPRIMTLSTLGRINYFPFYGQIENNFQPFVTIGGGINYVVDGPNERTGFVDNFKAAEKYFSPLIYFGGGLRFGVNPKMDLGVSAGYEIAPLNENSDDMENLNGLMLRINFLFKK